MGTKNRLHSALTTHHSPHYSLFAIRKLLMPLAQREQAPQAIADVQDVEVELVVEPFLVDRKLGQQLSDLGRGTGRAQVDVAEPIGPRLAQVAVERRAIDDVKPRLDGRTIHLVDRLRGRELGDHGLRFGIRSRRHVRMTQPGQLRGPDVAPYGLVALRLAGELDAIKTAVHDGPSPFLPVSMRVRTRPDLCARSHRTGRTVAGKFSLPVNRFTRS